MGRKCLAGGLERCSVAASEEAHSATNRPNIKTARIAFAPSVRRPKLSPQTLPVTPHDMRMVDRATKRRRFTIGSGRNPSPAPQEIALAVLNDYLGISASA
jgi:hypothetical protein